MGMRNFAFLLCFSFHTHIHTFPLLFVESQSFPFSFSHQFTRVPVLRTLQEIVTLTQNKWSHYCDLTEQNLHVFLCKTKCFQIDSLQLSPHGVCWETDLVSQRPQHVNVQQRSHTPKEILLFQCGQVLGSLSWNDWLDSSQNSILAGLAGK